MLGPAAFVWGAWLAAKLEIIGGLPVDERFEGVVSVTAGVQRCTGTLVASRLVLTAGHCLNNVTGPYEVWVAAGEDISLPRATSGVASYGVHPAFCDLCDEEIGDFAYLVLNQELATERVISPLVDQAEWDSTMRADKSVFLVGFGENRAMPGGLGIKNVAQVPIRRFSDRGYEFWAGGEGVDSCAGDSGGPALVQVRGGYLRLVGVTSRGADPCGDGGVYGVPYPALPWIDRYTGVNLCGADCPNCDCLDVSPPEEGCASSVSARRPRGFELVLLLLLAPFARNRALRSKLST
jgi:hypothetical protein